MYEFIPVILISLLFIYIGLRLSNQGVFGIAKLGLILGGLFLLVLGVLIGWSEISATF